MTRVKDGTFNSCSALQQQAVCCLTLLKLSVPDLWDRKENKTVLLLAWNQQEEGRKEGRGEGGRREEEGATAVLLSICYVQQQNLKKINSKLVTESRGPHTRPRALRQSFKNIKNNLSNLALDPIYLYKIRNIWHWLLATSLLTFFVTTIQSNLKWPRYRDESWTH